MSLQAIDGDRGRSDDPFVVLGLPRTFRLDLEKLRRTHRERAASVHPDRADGVEGREQALRQSALLNEAYRVLIDPMTRAEAILRLEGFVTDEGTGAPMAGAFLMEMMELREAADDAIAAGDTVRIAELRAGAEARRQQLLGELERGFDAAGHAAAAERVVAFADVRAALAALRYTERLLARLIPARA